MFEYEQELVRLREHVKNRNGAFSAPQPKPHGEPLLEDKSKKVLIDSLKKLSKVGGIQNCQLHIGKLHRMGCLNVNVYQNVGGS